MLGAGIFAPVAKVLHAVTGAPATVKIPQYEPKPAIQGIVVVEFCQEKEGTPLIADKVPFNSTHAAKIDEQELTGIIIDSEPQAKV